MHNTTYCQEAGLSTQPENEFDFWLGEWNVTWGETGKGTNNIERILGGKIIQENFIAPDLHGMSVSSFDPERGVWCQTWVDSNGSYLDFTGRFEDDRMILTRNAIVRDRHAGREWSGTISGKVNSSGIGNARMTTAKLGRYSGRSITRERSKQKKPL